MRCSMDVDRDIDLDVWPNLLLDLQFSLGLLLLLSFALPQSSSNTTCRQ